MDHPRCSHCRNPIRGHQRQVWDPVGDLGFHEDCWAAARAAIQQQYVDRVRAHGLDALVSPYVVRLDAEPWPTGPHPAEVEPRSTQLAS